MDNTNLLEVIRLNKQSAWNFRWRRHFDWLENYTLYRDKVFLNRLTQRQSVNVPLMKTCIQTLLKDNDDPPILYFSEKSNDSQREVFYNEVWNQSCKDNKFNIQDLIDKKQGFLFGRTFEKQTIRNGRHFWEVRDPQWMLVDRYTNPAIIDSARFIYDTSNYIPLSSLEEAGIYDKEAIARIKSYHSKQDGLSKAQDNLNLLQQQNERMQIMGVPDTANPVLGETYIEIVECYQKMYNPAHKQDEIRFIVIADNQEILLNEWQEDVIGVTSDNYWRDHYIYSSWALDPERLDFWSDGIGDVLRTPNKILNVWASQMIENRTMRSFGMIAYDNTLEADQKFNVQPLEPGPGKMFGFPVGPGKKLEDVMQHMKIDSLSDSLPDITYVTDFAQKAASVSNASQGQVEPRKYTFGEVSVALNEAKEKSKACSPLYTDNRQEMGVKFTKLLEAGRNLIDPMEVTKKGKQSDKLYSRIITPEDWYSQAGYVCEVKDVNATQAQDMDALQLLNAALAAMPNNKPLRRIYNRHILEVSRAFNSSEIKEVTDYEEQAQEVIDQQNAMSMLGAGGMGGQDPNAMPGKPMMLNPGSAPNVALPA